MSASSRCCLDVVVGVGRSGRIKVRVVALLFGRRCEKEVLREEGYHGVPDH